LREYHWPGNVRELENLIHREVLMATGGVLQLFPAAAASHGDDRHAPDEQWSQGATFADAKCRAVEGFEKEYLLRLMSEAEGNVTRAARIAGKERRALGKLLKKHGINSVFRADLTAPSPAGDARS